MYAETSFLLKKQAKQSRQPLEALLGGLVATACFVQVFLCLVFSLRYHNEILAFAAGPAFCAGVCLAILAMGVMRHRKGAPARVFFIIALAGLGGTMAGYILGDRCWWKNTVNYYNYQDMASYVNVDPGVDVGQSFMDAGTVYFKESSYVLSKKALAFHNGATYCVAPIVRQPVQMLPGQTSPFVLETVTGFSAPRSGTLDFWAVGTDCCGTSGTDMPFTCGDAASQLARSGMRVLNNAERGMYLLAVQEWSASAGLPVRHPIFFKWVKDPLADQEAYINNAWDTLAMYALVVLLVWTIMAFILQLILQMFKIRGQ